MLIIIKHVTIKKIIRKLNTFVAFLFMFELNSQNHRWIISIMSKIILDIFGYYLNEGSQLYYI